MQNGLSQHGDEDDRWNNASGEAANLLKPVDRDEFTTGLQQTARNQSVLQRTPLDGTGQQTIAGIALYALCTLCSSGERLVSAAWDQVTPRPHPRGSSPTQSNACSFHMGGVQVPVRPSVTHSGWPDILHSNHTGAACCFAQAPSGVQQCLAMRSVDPEHDTRPCA